MDTKELLQTITAIKVALQSGVGNNNGNAQLAIKIALGFCDNTLKKSEVKDEIHEVNEFDDLSPDYIRQSQEEI